jgi:hypothetical protein
MRITDPHNMLMSNNVSMQTPQKVKLRLHLCHYELETKFGVLENLDTNVDYVVEKFLLSSPSRLQNRWEK